MKGFHLRSSRLLKILLIGLAVLLGLLAEQQLRERILLTPLQIPAPEQSSTTPPIRADGPLHEVSERISADTATQSRWVF